jgi:hypothetical protein
MKPSRLLPGCLFLILLLSACGLRPGVPATSTPEPITPTPLTATPTALTFPTPPPSPTPFCPGAPRQRLIVQERGRVLLDDPRPINLRLQPGTAAAILIRIDPGEIFYVLEGPVCEGDFAWYHIRYGAREGWIAEGDLASYYVEPYLPG